MRDPLSVGAQPMLGGGSSRSDWGGVRGVGGGTEIKEEPKSRGDPGGFCGVPVLEGNFMGGVPGIRGGDTEIEEEPISRGDLNGFCGVPVLEGNLLGGVPGIGGRGA